MIATLPLAPRNRLADLIVAALSGRAARAELLTLARDETTPGGWLRPDEQFHAPLLVARVKSAAAALAKAPMWPPELTVEDALDAAATLFDAGLYFETHEVLEPKWREARGPGRETLQGLIQIAVGYQHLANGNLAGARALLAEGAARLRRPGDDDSPRDAMLATLRDELSRFADAVAASVGERDVGVPSFPRRAPVRARDAGPPRLDTRRRR